MPEKESKLLIYPKLQHYPSVSTVVSQEEMDQVAAHYTGQIFAALRNQNLISDKEIGKFMVIKEFINSVLMNNHNYYHPFTEIIDEILSVDPVTESDLPVDVAMHPDVEEHIKAEKALNGEMEEAFDAIPPKPKRKPRKKKETPTEKE